jgi:hypothetical protein
MKFDDGAVIYLNGVEVTRENMRTDLVVGNDTPAFGSANGENQWKVSCTLRTRFKGGMVFISNWIFFLLTCFLT